MLSSRKGSRQGVEWHDAKAEANLQAHGVSFELATTVFKDPFAIERLDDREDYGEERFVIVGMAEGEVLLFAAYNERGERIRLISARRATQHEQDDYFRQNA
ncbi:MAG: BrnT family toxin [Acidobacteriota bacterium]|nr:BrnT family toxin [Acidobacteriota bacterium]